MTKWLAILLAVASAGAAETNESLLANTNRTVVILPIRDNIMPPLTYLVRRGVKQAIEERADLLVLDMKTDGGRLDTTEEIIQILGEFKGDTVTYVNDRAFSAGAFISVATERIFMAPQSVIGAAAPIMLAPTGEPSSMPSTMEVKMNSAVRALVRRVAEKNGHNVEVVEAMIDKNKELIIDGEVINAKGDILTLTDTEAAKEYGDPPQPLLSEGTIETLDVLLLQLGYANARRIEIQPTGAERLGTWINAISPILLMIGVICLYIEFKTPGFGIPGIAGIVAFALYFAGSYVAGFAGFEWMLVFLIGLVLLGLEFFLFPGTVALGVIGAGLMVLSIIMALIDLYPGEPSTPGVPALPRFGAPTRDSVQHALQTMLLATVGSIIAVWLAGKWLPRTSVYAALVSQGASGTATVSAIETQQHSMVGRSGVALSPLRPGGKAQFAEQILDVMTQGEMLEKGVPVRIIAFSGATAIVEPA